jgi:hypothetical protein
MSMIEVALYECDACKGKSNPLFETPPSWVRLQGTEKHLCPECAKKLKEFHELFYYALGLSIPRTESLGVEG